MNSVFTGISEMICDVAWMVIRPSIEKAASAGITNKLAGAMIVLDPRSEEEFVLYANVIDDAQDPIYSNIAMAKASVTFKHRKPSSVVQQQYPYLYQEGDTKWGGCTIDAGGLIVALSGVQAVYDEMISEWMASAIRALSRFE